VIVSLEEMVYLDLKEIEVSLENVVHLVMEVLVHLVLQVPKVILV